MWLLLPNDQFGSSPARPKIGLAQEFKEQCFRDGANESTLARFDANPVQQRGGGLIVPCSGGLVAQAYPETLI